MIVLGCDAGKVTGLCLLDCSGRRPRYLWSHSAEQALACALDAQFSNHDIAIVGIENPTQVFAHGRAKDGMGARIGIERALLVAREASGIVKAVAALRSVRVVEGQAHEIRKAVIGRLPRTGKDAAVKAFVLRVVEGWPERSNDHERDAAVAAIFAWRRRAPLPVIPPMPKRRRRAA